MHRVQTSGVTIPLTTRGRALVSLACLDQGKRYPLASFFARVWRLNGGGVRRRRGRRRDLGLVFDADHLRRSAPGDDLLGRGARGKRRGLTDGHKLVLVDLLGGLYRRSAFPGRAP